MAAPPFPTGNMSTPMAIQDNNSCIWQSTTGRESAALDVAMSSNASFRHSGVRISAPCANLAPILIVLKAAQKEKADGKNHRVYEEKRITIDKRSTP